MEDDMSALKDTPSGRVTSGFLLGVLLGLLALLISAVTV